MTPQEQIMYDRFIAAEYTPGAAYMLATLGYKLQPQTLPIAVASKEN